MSNKYRCIKTYPGSPELGTIEEPVHNNVHIMSNGRYGYDFSKHKEFWEPVVEKDYEILKFILPGNNIVHIQNAKNSLKFMLKNSNTYKIYSVKRLSDSEIFTIGDKTNFGLISKIVINNNSLSFYFEQKSCGYNLQTLIKWKPLFTTEDGVDIFEGDNYFTLNTDFNVFEEIDDIWKIFQCKCKNIKKYSNSFFDKNNHQKRFSTKEKAEEYIIMNKKLFSISDIENLKLGVNYSKEALLKKLKKEAKIIV